MQQQCNLHIGTTTMQVPMCKLHVAKPVTAMPVFSSDVQQYMICKSGGAHAYVCHNAYSNLHCVVVYIYIYICTLIYRAYAIS